MTPDIEALARQAGLCLTGYGAVGCTTAELERFASIARDQALEAGAQVCDDNYAVGYTSNGCAKIIRALKGKP